MTLMTRILTSISFYFDKFEEIDMKIIKIKKSETSKVKSMFRNKMSG